MHAARPTHRLRSKRPAICSRCLQPVGMGVVRVGSQLRVPCSGPGAARVSRVRGGGAALPSQATCAKINGGYVMWVARWCVSLLRVTDAMFAAVFEREAQVPQGELVVWPGKVHANWVVDRLLAIDPCFQLHRDVVQCPVSPGGPTPGSGIATCTFRCGPSAPPRAIAIYLVLCLQPAHRGPSLCPRIRRVRLWRRGRFLPSGCL